MRILMISLDKKILDPDSAVARRMVEYGEKDELFIIIPDKEKKSFDLSQTVHVQSTGGNRLQQYFRLKKMGLELVKKYAIKFITVQDPSFSGNVGRWLKKKTGATLEIQLHGDFYGSDFYKDNFKDRIGYFFFGKKNIKAADKIRVVSERVKQSVLKLGIDQQKIEVKPVRETRYYMGEFIDFRKEYSQFEKIFVFVGRLVPVKNIDWLVKIFADVVRENSRCGLIIVGDGEQREYLEELVGRINLKGNIIFSGWIEHPWHKIHAVDALLFPSLSEGYGLVVSDALTSGCPLVIMNDVGVANYELKPSDRVKIIPVSDREAWIKAILEV